MSHHPPLPSPPISAATRLPHADGLRAVAALWVFLFHVSHATYLERLRARLPEAFNTVVLDHGDLGIAIFFVLSGFVVALSTAREGHAAPPPAAFLLRRLMRLTPPYYASIAATLVLAALWAAATGASVRWPSPTTLLAHLAYLQDAFDVPEINGVYWTLVVELQFYALYLSLTWLVRTRVAPPRQDAARIGLFALTALASMAVVGGALPTPEWFGRLTHTWCAFAAGVLGGWAWMHGGAAVWASRATIAAFVLLAPASAAHPSGLFAVSALTVIVLAESRALGPLPSWLASAPLRWMGALSYSFYLLHAPLQFVGFGIVRRLFAPGPTTDVIGLAASLAICLVAAAAMQRWIEAPSQRWSRRIGAPGPIARPVLDH